jgi:hypothetical protein
MEKTFVQVEEAAGANMFINLDHLIYFTQKESQVSINLSEGHNYVLNLTIEEFQNLISEFVYKK